ncbi:unnamed protein product [Allacma fusca]|uniref:tRNA (N(6)-L-threonylcarbamoyladenosine(37)-C(2))-methylthiotransferase n=1 Tax=Allacma fusca TaxID=39272 RepID=A0A8J2PWI0_9HEXA|nr:unnamed protein product [Allacma fusca]
MSPVEASGLDDIEDLGKNAEGTSRLQNRIRIRPNLNQKRLSNGTKAGSNAEGSTCDKDCEGSEVNGAESNDLRPNDYKVYLKTWGCSHNSSDSEYMAGLLNAHGFEITAEKKDADVWVLNSCTVKNPAEDHFKNELEAGRKSGKSLVLAGCVPQAAPKDPFIKGLSIIGVQQIDRIVEVVEETLQGNTAIAEILNHPQVFAFLHIPVQAGSDQVLVDMKREYSSAEFQRVVDVISEKVPGVTIATDIICGFPTESAKDFEDTMELCRKNKFKALYINQFYARKGTPAANMPRIDTRDVKKRTKALTDLFNSYLPYEKRIGQFYDVLVTEISHDKLHYVSHNKYYEQILVPQIEGIMGQWARVKIISFCKHSMTGEVLSFGPTKKSLVPTPWYQKQFISKDTSKFLIIFFVATLVFLKLLTIFT